MSWRTIVITKRAKLDLQLGFMVVRGEDTTKVALNEIAVVLIESTAVSLTTSLLAELTKRKVKVIFCDEKRNPSSELVSYYGSHDTSNKIRKQIAWRQNTKEAVWTEIVSEKIRKQKELLELLGKEEAELLSSYLQQIAWNDETNREGHAAKVYFNALFGLDFTRTEDNLINAALNYGYSIILSSFTREIVANGYITQDLYIKLLSIPALPFYILCTDLTASFFLIPSSYFPAFLLPSQQRLFLAFLP